MNGIAPFKQYFRSIGFESIQWQGNPIELSFTRYVVHLEAIGESVWLGASAKIEYRDKRHVYKEACQQVHYSRGLPYKIKAGLINDNTLIFSYLMDFQQITIDGIHQLVEILGSCIIRSLDSNGLEEPIQGKS